MKIKKSELKSIIKECINEYNNFLLNFDQVLFVNIDLYNKIFKNFDGLK